MTKLKDWEEKFDQQFVEYIGTRNKLEYLKGNIRGNDIKIFIKGLLKELYKDLPLN